MFVYLRTVIWNHKIIDTMNLSELTDKIYAEGVEKGNAEAQQIIAKAKAEAESIVAEAKKQAEALQAQAVAKAAELDKNTRA